VAAPLTLFYTGDLRGDLALLPPLYTHLRALRRDAPGRWLLVDIGDSCADSAWHCAVTGGRSTLVVLDGMGCAAANVAGALTEAARARLPDGLALSPVDDAHPALVSDIFFTLRGPAHAAAALTVQLRPSAATRLTDGVLTLAQVTAGQIGQVTVSEASLVAVTTHDLPPGTPHDPTIAASVQFVLSEARQAQRRAGRG
jgi:hypothetical protein